ncbi:MAG: hypothetical protein IPL87_00915 [Candidatus Moraniibacteriota bacterium]|nr:MAG: hypothetical protein IPL87_00915 [Candidatus Moranbacteria bacterium]
MLFVRTTFSFLVLVSLLFVPSNFSVAQTTTPTPGTIDTSTGWTGGFQAVKDNSGLSGKGVDVIVSGFMMWLLVIVGFLSIIAFIIAGIMYLTAAGNDGQIKNAKQAMFYSIVGVIVALVGYVVIQAVDFLLRGADSTGSITL